MKYLSLIAIFSFVCFTGCGISDDARTPSNDESATYYLSSIGGMPKMLMYITQDIFRNLIFTRTEQE